MVQLQLKQRTESLQNAESSLADMSAKLRNTEEAAEKDADRVKRVFEDCEYEILLCFIYFLIGPTSRYLQKHERKDITAKNTKNM
jgi:hypothetical protein